MVFKYEQFLKVNSISEAIQVESSKNNLGNRDKGSTVYLFHMTLGQVNYVLELHLLNLLGRMISLN